MDSNNDIVIKEEGDKRYFFYKGKLVCLIYIDPKEEVAKVEWKQKQINKLLFGNLDIDQDV